jgi:hypothetical protein
MFDAETFFRNLQKRNKVRYCMDLYEVLHHSITVLPFGAGMDVYHIKCGTDASDREMRMHVSTRRYFGFEEAAAFLVAELGNPFQQAPKFSRTHRNVLYLNDGTALNVWWHGGRKLWCIDRMRRGFGTWQAGDFFFGRYDAVEIAHLAA